MDVAQAVNQAHATGPQFTEQFKQTLAASVAALPFRGGLGGLGGFDRVSGFGGLPSPPPSVVNTSAGTSGQSPTSSLTSESSSTSRGASEDAESKSPGDATSTTAGTSNPNSNTLPKANAEANSGGGALDVNVMSAIAALSSLDKDKLAEVMRAQPTLREAINIILAHSAAVVESASP